MNKPHKYEENGLLNDDGSPTIDHPDHASNGAWVAHLGTLAEKKKLATKAVELRRIGKYVKGQGPVPCNVMVIGQNPGREESNRGVPFVGESGSELDKLYLPLAGLRHSDVYVDNLYRWRTPDNKDLNAAEIEFGITELFGTISRVNPKFVITLGTQVTEALLGAVNFDHVHGRPYLGGLISQAAVIIPAYHPAAGIHKPRTMNFIMQDWRDIGKIIRGEDVYHDYNRALRSGVIGVDTETVNGKLWSIQIATPDGKTTMHFDGDFDGMIAAHTIIEAADLVVYHHAVYDHAMLTSVGIKPKCYTDTMQMLYLLGNQHQGLKTAAKRFFNVDMMSYEELLLPYNNAKAVEYLARIANDYTSYTMWFPTKKAATAFIKTLPLAIDTKFEKLEDGWLTVVDTSNFSDPNPVIKSTGMTEIITQPTNVVILVRRTLKRYESDSSIDLRAWWEGCGSKDAAVAKYGDMPEATIADVKREDAVAYACKDAEVTLRLWHVLAPMMEAEGLDYALTIDMEIVPLINQMEANGLLVDKFKLGVLQTELQLRADKEFSRLQLYLFAEGFLQDADVFNPNSSDQVMAYLKFRHFNTKNTEAKYLEPLASHDEGIAMLLEYRRLLKLKSTYVDNLLYEAERSHDGRVRSHFNMNIADTGRLTSSNPVNWQNIPAHTEDGKRIREAVIAKDGCTFVSIDLVQIEIKVMAHLSLDENLSRMLLEGRDVHSETSVWLFGDAEKDHRTASKKTSFGIPYGVGALGLLDQFQAEGLVGWTEQKCEALINKWFGLYPLVKVMMDFYCREARDKGYVRTMFGRRRLIPEASSSLQKIQSSGKRNAGNAPIQGTAADILKIIMNEVRPVVDYYDGLSYCRVVNQIHDELLFEVADDIVEDFAAVAKAVFESAVKLSVPITADVEVGKSWGEMKEIYV